MRIPRNRRDYLKLLIDVNRKGGFPSVDSAGYSRYRGENRRCCPIGLLISDSEYDSSMEGKIVAYYPVSEALPPWMQEANDADAILDSLIELQELHDDMIAEGKWDADKFEREVRELPLFAGVSRMVP